MKTAPIVIKLPAQRRRSLVAVAAKARRAGAMRDPRAERGGAKNLQRRYATEE